MDARELHTAPSLVDIFDFGENWPREIQVALLVGEDTAEDENILETAAMGRAKQIRVFFDESAALSWLGEEPRELRWDSPV